MTETVIHNADLRSTGSPGSWATCPCGWASKVYRTTTGAHLEFGRHLLKVRLAEENR